MIRSFISDFNLTHDVTQGLQCTLERIYYTHRITKNAAVRLAVRHQATDYVIAAFVAAFLADWLTFKAAGSLILQFTVRPLDIGGTFKDVLPGFGDTFATAKRAAAQALGIFVSLAGVFSSLAGYSQWPLFVHHYLGSFEREVIQSKIETLQREIEPATRKAEEINQAAAALNLALDAALTTGVRAENSSAIGNSLSALKQEHNWRINVELYSSYSKHYWGAMEAHTSIVGSRPLAFAPIDKDLNDLAAKKLNQLAIMTLQREIELANRTAEEFNQAAAALNLALDAALTTDWNSSAIGNSLSALQQEDWRIRQLSWSYREHSWEAHIAHTGIIDSRPPLTINPINNDLYDLLGKKLDQYRKKEEERIEKAYTTSKSENELANKDAMAIYQAARDLIPALKEALKLEVKPENGSALIKSYVKLEPEVKRFGELVASYHLHCTKSLSAWKEATGKLKPILWDIGDRASRVTKKAQKLKKRVESVVTFRTPQNSNLTPAEARKVELDFLR